MHMYVAHENRRCIHSRAVLECDVLTVAGRPEEGYQQSLLGDHSLPVHYNGETSLLRKAVCMLHPHRIDRGSLPSDATACV